MMKYVLDKNTKQVKRHGYSDFENDGSFDSETEIIIVNSAILCPGIEFQNWYWNEQSQIFQTTPP